MNQLDQALAPILVIADPVRWFQPDLLSVPWRRRPRECSWEQHLIGSDRSSDGGTPRRRVDVVSIQQLEAAGREVRFWDYGLVVLNWDAANGDAACGSDETLAFFRAAGPLRIKQLAARGGIFLCEGQLVSGVPIQSAYDAIFGQGQLRVVSGYETLPYDERHGSSIRALTKRISSSPIHFLLARHPLVYGVPRKVQAAPLNGRRLFNLRNVSPTIDDKGKGILWWGWFSQWRRGWVPLLYADLPKDSYKQKTLRGYRPIRCPVLLARCYGRGVLIASTMWISVGEFGQLTKNITSVLDDPNGIERLRRFHRYIGLARGALDVIMGLLVAGALTLAAELTWRSVGQPARTFGIVDAARWLTFLGVGIVTLVTGLWAWYRRCVWARPFGYSLIRATMSWARMPGAWGTGRVWSKSASIIQGPRQSAGVFGDSPEP